MPPIQNPQPRGSESDPAGDPLAFYVSQVRPRENGSGQTIRHPYKRGKVTPRNTETFQGLGDSLKKKKNIA